MELFVWKEAADKLLLFNNPRVYIFFDLLKQNLTWALIGISDLRLLMHDCL